MRAFFALLMRDLRLATRAGGSALLSLAFFAAVSIFVPFAVGTDTQLLAHVGAGIIWIAAVLAALLALDRLFQADFEDGSLDLIALGPLSLEGVAVAKIGAHWLTTGLPLTMLSPVIALMFKIPPVTYPALIGSLALGTLAVSAIGAIGGALTLTVRRGGLILSLLILPLLSPAVIFGAGAVLSVENGLANGAFWLLAAFSAGAVVLSPFAAGAAVRLNLAG
jgi:heme exporter protein B